MTAAPVSAAAAMTELPDLAPSTDIGLDQRLDHHARNVRSRVGCVALVNARPLGDLSTAAGLSDQAGAELPVDEIGPDPPPRSPGAGGPPPGRRDRHDPARQRRDRAA